MILKTRFVQAQDMGIEDSLEVLSNALNGGTMSLDVYVRTFRVLAEEQYKFRLLGMKIQEKQNARQHQSQASAVPTYGQDAVRLPQGDAWGRTAAYPVIG